VHLPLILSTEKGKLSKRHGDFSVASFLERGYLREALVNFVALLGWHPQEDEEIFPLQRMVDEFSFERINKAGAVFDITKLDWMNGMYLRSLPLARICEDARPFFEQAGLSTAEPHYTRVVNEARGRVSRLDQIGDVAVLSNNTPVTTTKAAPAGPRRARAACWPGGRSTCARAGTHPDDTARWCSGHRALGIKGKATTCRCGWRSSAAPTVRHPALVAPWGRKRRTIASIKL
jgi:hypothetical protein